VDVVEVFTYGMFCAHGITGTDRFRGLPPGAHVPQASAVLGRGGVKGAISLREAGSFLGPSLHTAHEGPEFK